MKIILLTVVLVSISLSDDITLKSGFVVRNVSIIEINNQHVRYSAADGIEQRFQLRDISTVFHQQNDSVDTLDYIFLRNGDIADGTIANLEYNHVTIIIAAGDTVRYEPSAVLRVTGKQSAFSFHSIDDKYFFLTGANIHFVGGKPSKSLTQSEYRFIVSISSSLPLPSFSFQYPLLLDGKAKTGYSISFSVDHGISLGNDLSFSYRFMENTIGSSDSLPGSFTEWSNHFLLAGIKRSFTIADPVRIYGEAKAGYGVTIPPEHHDLSSEQAAGFAWSIGGGIYLSENISFDALYLSEASDVTTRAALPFSQSSKAIIRQQRVSTILAGISYTFGSGN